MFSDINGRAGETRTLKDITPGDFESPASTNSATTPIYNIYQSFLFIIQYFFTNSDQIISY